MVNFEDSIAHEAHSLVHGDRAKSYGHPRFDFRIIAKVWSGLMQDLLKDGAELDEYRVAVMMSGLKLCRLVKSPAHHDSRVDTIGYMLTMERLDEPDLEDPAVVDAAIKAYTTGEYGSTPVDDGPSVEYKHEPPVAFTYIAPDGREYKSDFKLQEDQAVWSGNLGNPSENDVAVAQDVLARRQAFHDQEAAKLLKKGPRNG
jgi:hypothetical protein